MIIRIVIIVIIVVIIVIVIIVIIAGCSEEGSFMRGIPMTQIQDGARLDTDQCMRPPGSFTRRQTCTVPSAVRADP